MSTAGLYQRRVLSLSKVTQDLEDHGKQSRFYSRSSREALKSLTQGNDMIPTAGGQGAPGSGDPRQVTRKGINPIPCAWPQSTERMASR